ncbi:30S ribosomal protein S21 [Candidatus Parcubacteria bacterium]|nr:30S ribosomal protein S21 [Candidatus Parcubacteria bacterium]
MQFGRRGVPSPALSQSSLRRWTGPVRQKCADFVGPELSVVDVKRKKGESFESFLRRFGRRLQQSGNQLEARKIRFYKEKPNKNKMRESALRRKLMGEKREYLLRIGQVVDEPRKPRRR